MAFAKQAKKWTGKLHLWLGLASGLIVTVICATGSVLALQDTVVELANHKKMSVEPGEKRVPIDQVLATYHEDFDIPPSRLYIPENKDGSILIWARDRQAGVSVRAYYNPYTAEFLGTENEVVSRFFSQTMRLHRWLLVRQPGKLIVGIATAMFLFMLLSGLILWWPRRWKAVKAGLTINEKAPWKALNYQLHNVLGFYSLLLLFLMAFSGLYISQNWFRNGVLIGLGGEPTEGHSHGPRPTRKNDKTASLEKTSDNKPIVVQANGRRKGPSSEDASPNGKSRDTKSTSSRPNQSMKKGRHRGKGQKIKAEPINFQYMLDTAQEKLPYSSEIVISFPRRAGGEGRIIKYKSKWGAIVSESALFDAATGQITGVETFSEKSTADQYRSINRNLHTGDLMGWPMKVLYFLACLVGTSLPITGTIIWWNKRRR